MTESKAIYETNTIPKTLGQVLRALSAPFPEDQCAWRILTKNGPGDNWVWVKYPMGEFMKLRLAQSCSGGYDISYQDRLLDDRLNSTATLVIYDPERPTEHKMTLVGVGERVLSTRLGEMVTDADVVKAAHTYAVKDACEQAGMGVGVGERAYTIPYTNPDGEKTDKDSIPLSEYQNGNMTGRRDSSRVLTTAEAVRVWLKAVADKADAEAHRPTHVKALASTLEDMEFDPKEVIAAAWGEKTPTVQQVIATRQLAGRTNAKEEIALLLR